VTLQGTIGFISGFGDGTSIAILEDCPLSNGISMSIAKVPSPARADAASAVEATSPHEWDEPSSRAWPRCEPASTHFELGASADYRSAAVIAKRYSPRYGVPKD
jgi:hypothetical protein